jgi:hypothetical protein
MSQSAQLWKVLVAGAALLCIVGVISYLIVADSTKKALREFGYEGHWANDCAQGPDPVRAANVHVLHQIPWFGNATDTINYQGAERSVATIVDAKIVADNKLLVVTETLSATNPSQPDLAQYKRTTETVFIKINGQLQITDEKITLLITSPGLNPTRPGTFPGVGQVVLGGETTHFVAVKDGWFVFGTGEHAGVARPYEKCRD